MTHIFGDETNEQGNQEACDGTDAVADAEDDSSELWRDVDRVDEEASVLEAAKTDTQGEEHDRDVGLRTVYETQAQDQQRRDHLAWKHK